MSSRVLGLTLTACFLIGSVQAADIGLTEQAVWHATAVLARENESVAVEGPRPLAVFRRSSFPREQHALDQLQQAARAGFCDLSPAESADIVSRLTSANRGSVAIEGLRSADSHIELTGVRPREGDYLGLSRVVFSEDGAAAYLGVDISKLSGSIVMLQKVDGNWKNLRECAEWVSC